MFNMPLYYILTVAGVSAVAGYSLVFFYEVYMRRRSMIISLAQFHQIQSAAKKQAQQVFAQELEQSSAKVLEEELNEELDEKATSFKNTEEDIALRQQFVDDEEKRLQTVELELQTSSQKVEVLSSRHNEIQQQVANLNNDLQTRLETKAGVNATNLKKQITEQMIHNRQMNCQKYLKESISRLEGDAKRAANRALARCLARYAPNFFWPKQLNSVELDKSFVAVFSQENLPIITDLKELAEIEIEFTPSENPKVPDMLKLAGGMGLKREAARITILEMLKKPQAAWGKTRDEYKHQEEKLWNQSLELGRKAVMNLKLENIHPEIQRMVGFLNWRTSYRQNQYLHTFEVAKFAGIIGPELGVDGDHAKRCGLMHDIGKSIDYRIEGGHAVISGDYADRFGESQLICDTVMSHHDELVVETPLAFVLKTADTLSGARPGARVNLEEGYQMRLSGINDAIRSFDGIMKVEIMNGAREVHVEVDHTRISDQDLAALSAKIAQKIEKEVAFPGQIKILLSRRYEATATA